jgi:diaminopimelate epimerase
MEFIKAHAYGNDFLMIAAVDAARRPDLSALARAVCHRHHGIGADGLMIVEETAEGARTRLLNADGSRSEISGNGIRCVAAWLAHTRGLEEGGHVVLETEAGSKRIDILSAVGLTFTCRAAMGQPGSHVSQARLHSVAAALAVHPYFPQGTNVELASVEQPDRIKILIWERGVGPTEASGTGACAAAVAAAAFGGAARVSDVVAPGGTQRVEWLEDGIYLTGAATVIGRAEIWTGR